MTLRPFPAGRTHIPVEPELGNARAARGAQEGSNFSTTVAGKGGKGRAEDTVRGEVNCHGGVWL